MQNNKKIRLIPPEWVHITNPSLVRYTLNLHNFPFPIHFRHYWWYPFYTHGSPSGRVYTVCYHFRSRMWLTACCFTWCHFRWFVRSSGDSCSWSTQHHLKRHAFSQLPWSTFPLGFTSFALAQTFNPPFSTDSFLASLCALESTWPFLTLKYPAY